MTSLEGSSLDETWARLYEPHLKRQSNEWKLPGFPRAKKVRPTHSNVKEIFIVACDIEGVILHHTVPQRHTVNAAYYCSLPRKHLRPTLRRKRQHLLQRNPSSFMTMQGLILPTSRISFAAGDGRYWNNRHTHPICVHAIMIFAPK